MPTYDYLCKKCGHEFEEFQSMTAEPVAKCPACGKKAKRLISAGAGLIFKGSGFYITDYKKNQSGGDSATPKESTKESKPECATPAAAPGTPPAVAKPAANAN